MGLVTDHASMLRKDNIRVQSHILWNQSCSWYSFLVVLLAICWNSGEVNWSANGVLTGSLQSPKNITAQWLTMIRFMGLEREAQPPDFFFGSSLETLHPSNIPRIHCSRWLNHEAKLWREPCGRTWTWMPRRFRWWRCCGCRAGARTISSVPRIG